jgi:outer membrane protein insertion porin family
MENHKTRSWKIFLYYWLLAFCLICTLPTYTMAAEEDVEAAKQGLIIGRIQTVGNKSITDAQILSRARSRVGDVFKPATAAEDIKRIARLEGVKYAYYNTETVDGKVQLTYVIVEKNLVRSVAFTGNNKYKTNTLAKQLHFKKGDYLDPILAEADRISLIEFYQKKGFHFVRVTLNKAKLDKGQLFYTIDEGPRVKIGAVNFNGNNSIKTGKLKNAVKTKKRKFFFFQNYYAEDRVTSDVIKLQNAYYKRGFLNAAVTSKADFNRDLNKVSITFMIEEGPVYSVKKIIFTGNRHFGHDELLADSKLKPADVYSKKRADSDVKRLLKFYRENGFIDVNIRHKRDFALDNKVVAEFEIDEGERFRIGRVNITGNEQTQDKVIRRILDEYDFQPGKWYNSDMARGDGSGDLEKTVKRMALTETVTITPTGNVPGQKDAQVSVVEGQTGMVMIGAGIASDSGLIGQMVFEQRNFDIKDTPESFEEFITGQAFKGAGQSLRIALSPGTEVSEYSVTFNEPYLNDKPISFDLIGSSYERERESYDEGRLRSYVGFEKRQKDKWRKGIDFRIENVDVDSIDTDAPKEIQDVKGDNVLFGVRFNFGRDLTNDRFNPTSGHSFNVGFEQVAGDHTFSIVSGTYRKYFTLHEDLAERKTILSTKLHAATTFGGAPPFEKFYAGGSYSMRGFDYRGVSTRGLPTNSSSTKRKDPIGSDFLFLASAEAIVPLVSNDFAALFFIDSGAIDTGPYRVAVGTGIQILVPQWFGPVPMRFEFAAPILKDDEDDTQTFSFSVGRLF